MEAIKPIHKRDLGNKVASFERVYGDGNKDSNHTRTYKSSEGKELKRDADKVMHEYSEDHQEIGTYKEIIHDGTKGSQTFIDKNGNILTIDAKTHQVNKYSNAHDLKDTIPPIVPVEGARITPPVKGTQQISPIAGKGTRYDPALFALEGNNPFVDANTLRFSGAVNGVMTPNGHGPRNEMKIKVSERKPVNSLLETASGTITPVFGNDYKSIVAQYHNASVHTMFKLYVNTREDVTPDNKQSPKPGGSSDGYANVYAKWFNPETQKEEAINYGRIKSGDKLDFTFTNDHGKFSFSVNGKHSGPHDVTGSNEQAGYFKFGDYEQDHAVAGSSVTFTDFNYNRST